MIGYVSGKLMQIEDGNALVDVQGVGYLIHVPNRADIALLSGATVSFYIHTNLRENSLELFGFPTDWEKKVFLLLTSVSGIGPKTALTMLSAHDPDWLLQVIAKEDKTALTRVPGIGKKTADRVALELAEKAQKLLLDRPKSSLLSAAIGSATSALGSSSGSPEPSEPYAHLKSAVEALVGLGYRDSDALVALREVTAHWPEDGGTLTLEKLIRGALQFIARARKAEI